MSDANSKKRKSKPLIVTNLDHNDGPANVLQINFDYLIGLENAGAIPLCLPPSSHKNDIKAALTGCDGVLLIGGKDYDPHLWGAERHPETLLMSKTRQDFDINLARYALDRGYPVLGICGGHQLLAIARGGALIQNIQTEWVSLQGKPPLPHAKDERLGPEATSFLHALAIREDSLVARAIGSAPATGLSVNSFHHQAVRPENVGEGLYASAWSADGVIEALEPAPDSAWARSGRFLLGVQWHPERMQDQTPQRRLFRSFIEAAAGRRP